MSANVQSKTGHKTYNQTQFNGDTAREQEAYAMTKVVSMLERAMENPEDRKGYYDAIQRNQKLWTAINISMLDPDHEVPERVRENLLKLGLFISNHTKGLLGSYNPEELQVIIDINKSIALGLKGITPDQKRAF